MNTTTGSFQAVLQKMHSRVEVKFATIRKICPIGEGVSSTVWRYEDIVSDTFLALKQIPMNSDSSCVSMVAKELVLCFGINHPAVTTCHSVFFTSNNKSNLHFMDNSFHLAMELMDGGWMLDVLTMCKVVDRNAHFMPTDVLACIAESVLSVLDLLQDEIHIIHRDVKPANILVSTSGQAKLADLGIAWDLACTTSHDNHTKEWVGTTLYMSLERLRGDRYSFSSDIWSLGLVLVDVASENYT